MTAPKILIADDEPFNIDYLEQELEESNYQTIAAVNGQEVVIPARFTLVPNVMIEPRPNVIGALGNKPVQVADGPLRVGR